MKGVFHSTDWDERLWCTICVEWIYKFRKNKKSIIEIEVEKKWKLQQRMAPQMPVTWHYRFWITPVGMCTSQRNIRGPKGTIGFEWPLWISANNPVIRIRRCMRIWTRSYFNSCVHEVTFVQKPLTFLVSTLAALSVVCSDLKGSIRRSLWLNNTSPNTTHLRIYFMTLQQLLGIESCVIHIRVVQKKSRVKNVLLWAAKIVSVWKKIIRFFFIFKFENI